MLAFVNLMTATFSKKFAASHRELSSARIELAGWLKLRTEPITPSEIVAADIEMVTSELCANVIDHTSARWIEIEVHLGTEYATITVTNPSSALEVPAVEEWGHLEEGDRGRGLRIIRALCDTVVVTGDASTTHFRCDVPTG
jgi:anti-sigma regulatory factor (Ser/Thr protein kinase)